MYITVYIYIYLSIIIYLYLSVFLILCPFWRFRQLQFIDPENMMELWEGHQNNSISGQLQCQQATRSSANELILSYAKFTDYIVVID